MSLSAHAGLAWGVPITDPEDNFDGDLEQYPEEGYEERIEAMLEEDSDLHGIFGFTEECPALPSHVRELPKWSKTPEYQAWEKERDAWLARQAFTVPVAFDFYGTYEYGGKVLIVSRTLTSVNWGVGVVDPACLTPPDGRETAALGKVLDHIDYHGDRTPKLLLFALYG